MLRALLVFLAFASSTTFASLTVSNECNHEIYAAVAWRESSGVQGQADSWSATRTYGFVRIGPYKNETFSRDGIFAVRIEKNGVPYSDVTGRNVSFVCGNSKDGMDFTIFESDYTGQGRAQLAPLAQCRLKPTQPQQAEQKSGYWMAFQNLNNPSAPNSTYTVKNCNKQIVNPTRIKARYSVKSSPMNFFRVGPLENNSLWLFNKSNTSEVVQMTATEVKDDYVVLYDRNSKVSYILQHDNFQVRLPGSTWQKSGSGIWTSDNYTGTGTCNTSEQP